MPEPSVPRGAAGAKGHDVDHHAEQIRRGEARYGWRHLTRPWYFSWRNYVEGRGSSYRTPCCSDAYKGFVLDHICTWKDRDGTKILTIEVYHDEDYPPLLNLIKLVESVGCTVETTRESLWYPEGHLLLVIIRVGQRPIEPKESEPLPTCEVCDLPITPRSRRFEFLGRDGGVVAVACYRCANRDMDGVHQQIFGCTGSHGLLTGHPHRWMRGDRVV